MGRIVTLKIPKISASAGAPFTRSVRQAGDPFRAKAEAFQKIAGAIGDIGQVIERRRTEQAKDYTLLNRTAMNSESTTEFENAKRTNINSPVGVTDNLLKSFDKRSRLVLKGAPNERAKKMLEQEFAVMRATLGVRGRSWENKRAITLGQENSELVGKELGSRPVGDEAAFDDLMLISEMNVQIAEVAGRDWANEDKAKISDSIRNHTISGRMNQLIKGSTPNYPRARRFLESLKKTIPRDEVAIWETRIGNAKRSFNDREAHDERQEIKQNKKSFILTQKNMVGLFRASRDGEDVQGVVETLHAKGQFSSSRFTPRKESLMSGVEVRDSKDLLYKAFAQLEIDQEDYNYSDIVNNIRTGKISLEDGVNFLEQAALVTDNKALNKDMSASTQLIKSMSKNRNTGKVDFATTYRRTKLRDEFLEKFAISPTVAAKLALQKDGVGLKNMAEVNLGHYNVKAIDQSTLDGAREASRALVRLMTKFALEDNEERLREVEKDLNANIQRVRLFKEMQDLPDISKFELRNEVK